LIALCKILSKKAFEMKLVPNILMLTVLAVIFSVQVYHAKGQIIDYNQEKVKSLKNYKSITLENGLTIVQLNNADSASCFIRAYTNLPEYVAKNFRVMHQIDSEFRNSSTVFLPTGYTKENLGKEQIVVKKDYLGFYASLPVSRLDKALLLFSDLMQKPGATASDLENAKRSILSKSDSLSKSLTSQIDRVTKSIIYGKEHPILKQFAAQEVNAATHQAYLDFFDRFYKPNISYLVVFANIPIDSIKSLADKSFGLWKKREVPSADYKLIPVEEPKIVFFDTVPFGKTQIKILFPFALHPFTFDSEKAELLSLVFQDVLLDKLLQNHILANSVSAKFESDKISGNYQLQVNLTNDSLSAVIETIIQTIGDFRAGRFPMETLAKAKKQIIDDFKGNGTTDQYLSQLIINTERNNLSKNFYADFVDEIDKTDIQGMQTFAAKYLNYQTALFQIPGKWYASLNDFIKLSKNFRIELYSPEGSLQKFIPKGFDGFTVIDNYITAIGGVQNIRRLKDVSIKYGALYELASGEKLLVEGQMLHGVGEKYYAEAHMIRHQRDTIFLSKEIFNGNLGIDSTMQGKKTLQGTGLELLKYKSPIVPELKYKDWQFNTRLVKADTLKGSYVWVVQMENPAKQKITDYYHVDKGIRIVREINDQQYFNKRVIHYSRYQRNKDSEILYPYIKLIEAPDATIRMIIKEVNYDTKLPAKLFTIF
jgi:zinc protease